MNYPFKNLVFKGGGIRGIAYLGALEVLDQKGILPQIEHVAGASAGAISALLVALGYDYKEIKKRSDSLVFADIPEDPKHPGRAKFINKELEQLYPDNIAPPMLEHGKEVGSIHLKNVRYLRRRYGLFKTNYVYKWFGDQIEAKCGKRNATFQEMATTNGCKQLSVTITDAPKRASILCNVKHTPNVEVAKAVLASMSIPIFFEPVIIDTPPLRGMYSDGGMMHNFPISVYDYNGINEETLGLFLYTKEGYPQHPYKLKNYVGDTVFSLLTAQDWAFGRRPQDVSRTIQIFDCEVPATNFDVSSGDQTYNKFLQAGRDGANEYFRNYDNENIAANSKPKFLDFQQQLA